MYKISKINSGSTMSPQTFDIKVHNSFNDIYLEFAVK